MEGLKCPRCEISLEEVLHEKIAVDTCHKCKGVWVEHADTKDMLQIKPEVFTMDEIKRLRKLYEPLGKREPVRYIACPVCREMMNRRNWGSHSGVIVDKCEDHGTWYDDGEIDKIREFISLGGIEFEKMRAPQKEAVRLNSKLSNEIARVDRRVDSAYRRARFWSIIGF